MVSSLGLEAALVMEETYEYKGKLYSRVGGTWLDRDRLQVSDLLAARLTMEVDGKPASPPEPPAKAKSSRAKTTKTAKAATTKAPKATKTPKTTKTKKKAEAEEAE